jgi:hypothetical protein
MRHISGKPVTGTRSQITLPSPLGFLSSSSLLSTPKKQSAASIAEAEYKEYRIKQRKKRSPNIQAGASEGNLSKS